jgi:Domain of unknown function (DUF4158)
MKRTWDIEELIEHFTLVSSELELLGNKTEATRLGFALLLKCFQLEGRFPTAKREIPRSVIDYVAHQLKLDAALFTEYDWEGRTITNHRTQIREHFAFRDASSADAEEVINWLISTDQAAMPHLERLKATVYGRFRELRLLPPTSDRIERLIHSACATAEQQFFADTFERLSDTSRTRIDTLLTSSLEAEEENEESSPGEIGEDVEGDEETVPLNQVTWHELKLNPGPVGVKSVRQEIAKLRTLEHLKLPEDLFSTVPTKVLSRYQQRASTDTLHELRRHPDATLYALLAAFCWQRRHELLDTLIDLLLLIIHKIGTRAEKRVDKELLEDFKRVDGKGRLLYRMAEASLAQPDGTVREVVYKVVGEQRLKDIVKEYKARGIAYHAQVHTVMRASYQRHYRQVVPLLLLLLILAGCAQVAGGSSSGWSHTDTYDCKPKVPITITEVERSTQLNLHMPTPDHNGPDDCLLVAAYGIGVDIECGPTTPGTIYQLALSHWDYHVAHAKQRGFVHVPGVDSILEQDRISSVLMKTAATLCIILMQIGNGPNSNADLERETKQEIELARLIAPRIA